MTDPVVYDIDFAKLVRWLLPRKIRNSRLIEWLYALTGPVVYLYQDFLRFRKQKLYELMITPQVCYLEALLNDRYDFTARGIYIVDAIEYPPLYLALDSELDPVYLATDAEADPVYLPTDGESGSLTDDFIIMVPASVVFNEQEMRSLVNVYKLAGMKFKIQIF